MRIFLTLFLAISLVSINIANAQNKSAQVTKVNFTKLSGFTLKPEAEPRSGYFTQLFARKVQFDQHFNPDKGKSSSLINFDKFSVLAGAVAKSKYETTISIEKIQKNKGVMEVYFITTTGKKLETRKTVPQVLYTIGQDNSIFGINYYVNGKLEMELRN